MFRCSYYPSIPQNNTMTVSFSCTCKHLSTIILSAGRRPSQTGSLLTYRASLHPWSKTLFFHKASDPFERVRANRNTGGFTSQKSLFPPKNTSKLCGEVNWKTEETLIGTLLFELSSAVLHTTAWVLGQIWMELSFMLSPSNCRMMYDGSHRTIPRAKSE